MVKMNKFTKGLSLWEVRLLATSGGHVPATLIKKMDI